MEQMTTVEQVLRQGGDIKDVMAIVREEIEKVQAKLEAEKRAKEQEEKAARDQELRIKVARQELVPAVINYMIALGVVKAEDISNEDAELLEDMLKGTEATIAKYAAIVEQLAPLTKDKTPTRVRVVNGAGDADLDTIDELIKHMAKGL